MAERGLILPRTIPTSSWSLWGWGAAPSPPAPALGRAELLCGAVGTWYCPRHPHRSHRITIPVQTFSNLQIRGGQDGGAVSGV